MKTITVEGDGVTVTVSTATVEMGLNRAKMRKAVNSEEIPSDLRLFYSVSFIDITAATIAIQGASFPISFEKVLALPDEFVERWEKAVYDLNPHWLPVHGNEEDTDTLIRELSSRHRARNSARDEVPELPDVIKLIDKEGAFQLWQLLEATGWAWPPDVLLRQDEAVMLDLMVLSGMAHKIGKMIDNG